MISDYDRNQQARERQLDNYTKLCHDADRLLADPDANPDVIHVKLEQATILHRALYGPQKGYDS